MTDLVDCLIEIDEDTGREIIIDNFVIDFFEYEKQIFYVKETDNFPKKYQVYEYCKHDSSKNMLSPEIGEKNWLPRGGILSFMREKIFPKERHICVSENKIVYELDYKAYTINHDGRQKG